MYRKRATLLTINSVTFAALSEVRRSRNSLYSIKAFGFVRNLSTATERFDFQNPNGSTGEKCVEYQQNPSGVYGENPNHVEFQQNPNGFYKGNAIGVQKSPRIGFQNNPVGQNGNFSSGYCRESNRNEFQGNPIEQKGNFRSNYGGYNMESLGTSLKSSNGLSGEHMSVQNPYGSYREGQLVVQQNPNGFHGQSKLGFSGRVNGHYGESVGQFQRSASDDYSGNTGVSQQKTNNYSLGNTRTTQQSPDNYYSRGTEMSQQYPHNYSRSKDGTNWQNPSVSGHYSGNTGVSQQNPINPYMGNTGMTQQYPGNYRPGSTGIYQHGTGTQYAGSDGVYQQSTSGYLGESAGTPNRYAMQNIGEDRQNPSGIYNANTNAGTYQNMSNELQSGMMDSQVSNDYKAGGESVEAAESRQYSGTVEELDGFCKEGKLKEVVELLGLLEGKHIPVDLPRYLMLMKACGEAKALQEAKYVHEHLMRSVSIPEVSTYNRILEMYGKCGSMDDAFTVFDKMPRRNLTSWDTMITWLANNGHGEDAIELFTQFKKAGLKPDGEMFFRVFSACSVLGDVIDGMLHFESMRKDYGIVPLMEHYVSVVDMLGSAGYLDEALEFVEKMPVEPSVEVWETLMNLGRVHGNTELGDRCAELVELMDPSRLNEQSKSGLIQVKAPDLAKEKEKKKLANENLLAVRSRVHEYRAGDRSHPENDRIYAQLRGMREQMKEAGYVAETRFVLHDIDQEGKEEALLAHSERLAVAYGFLTTPARAQIRIIKNLRVCGDCHSALKIISKLVGRELIIRDAKRFHHFKDGLCSCRDYW
ncbi:pentatricopeptide repeat-containing protein At4g32450, mitochondrial [Camellia sinensis]|uniref:DYW domain-containing protein n=1 Tax=Camellia sinensis var. sinensis TaxID=542762 RepID=A0A4S4DU93_CAMSN|nr:pentatricopeptide repeat-containing protein At4g32450, mitochondrial [Camellia sinensis]THG06852.1 hypothetical protein TEA_010189 [Camellia sinensis var. sinensis]